METKLYSQTATAGKGLMILLIALLFSGMTYAQAPALTLLSPNGGETWLQGSTCTISWEYSGGPATGVIEYTEDGGQYWYYLDFIYALDSVNSYTFQNYIFPTSQAKIRISEYNNAGITDESDDFFTVTEPAVYVYSPYFGNSYYCGSPVYISWFSNSIETFSLEYSLDNGETWASIINDLTGFEYSWTAPEVASNEALIRIADAADPSAYGLSAVFSIAELPDLTITSPNGGEIWNFGQYVTVTWTGSNLQAYVQIEFSADGGNSWSSLGYGYGNPEGGSADIYVPYVGTENALVRIIDYSYYFELDRSDAPFTVVVPPVILYYPSGGEQYYNNQQMYFSWTTSQDITEVNFELSTDGGQIWQLVDQNIPSSLGYYYWTVNGTPSEYCFIRISNADNSTEFGLSGVFTILETPVITLTSPTGGEIWNTGTPKTISWEYEQPGASYVYIDYTVDNGQTWNFINYALIDGPQGSIEWTTPEINSDQFRIRILDLNLQFVADTSAPFTIIDYPETPICMVSVDSTTNRNVIVWEKPVSDLIDQYVVYKESNQANIYEVLSLVDYEGVAMVTDTNSNPNVKSYRYKLGFRNVDGIDFPAGNHHQTIHLTINQGVGNSWNLLWSDYEGFEVSSYNIYRKIAGGEFEQISSISASFNSYTDVSVQSGDVYYIIEVVNPNGCNPNRTGEYGSSWSNVATNSFAGFKDNKMAMNLSTYPNPAGEKLNLSIGQDLQGSVQIALSDLLGRTVHSREVMDLKSNSIYTIDVSDLKEGIYILKVSSDEGSTTRKVIVRH